MPKGGIETPHPVSTDGADQRRPWNAEPAFRYVADPLNKSSVEQHPGIERPDLAEVSKVKASERVSDRETARPIVAGR